MYKATDFQWEQKFGVMKENYRHYGDAWFKSIAVMPNKIICRIVFPPFSFFFGLFSRFLLS